MTTYRLGGPHFSSEGGAGVYNLHMHLSCSSLPEYAQCVFDRNTTAALSSGSQQVRLVLNASTVLEYGPRGTARASRVVGRAIEYALLLGITFVTPFRHNRKLRGLALCACLLAAVGTAARFHCQQARETTPFTSQPPQQEPLLPCSTMQA